MGYESCVNRYSHYFSSKLKEIFKYHDMPIPYILELLDEFCPDRSCRHHIFSSHLVLEKRGQTFNQNAELAQKCHGCMCLLGILTDSATYQAIADTYGISKQAVVWTEKESFKKMRGGPLCQL